MAPLNKVCLPFFMKNQNEYSSLTTPIKKTSQPPTVAQDEILFSEQGPGTLGVCRGFH